MPKRPKVPGRFILTMALLMLCSGIMLLVHTSPSKPKVHVLAHIDNSIVRLHDATTGRFFCSGTVINDTHILTAAHCVVRAGDPFGLTFDIVRKVEIRSVDGKPLGLYAEFQAANPRQDVAILSGAFSEFDHMRVEVRPEAIERSFLHSEHLKACGYPAGGRLVCTTVKNVRHMNFGFGADGFLYPGMSGGPVIDEETGAIIAVNTAVDGERIYVSPTEELYNQLRP